ncbi:helix-turn-helix domain-containing protein [Thalassotalea ponticola]|nr:helix-turn-helix domain-containing protein [Thalassotalea ponticola]MDN3651989.1 helix-turn-helix domain-containing protein [Thalassotalea ponticola]
MNTPYVFLLVTALISIIGTVVFQPKRVEHFLFVILAVSLLLLAISEILPTSFVIEQQLVALGTFATCNVYWLLARTVFRKGKALSTQHYALAGVIAVLILITRSLEFFVSLQWLQQEAFIWFERSLSELLRLLSSAVLLLAFWEAIRNYSSANKVVRQQKALFASSMLVAVMSTRVIVPSVPLAPEDINQIYLWTRGAAACLILASTFIVLWLQQKQRQQLSSAHKGAKREDEGDQLLTMIINLMEGDRFYLKPELKMMDVANILNIPEYKISRVIRDKTGCEHFNQFVNDFRIKHAKQLLVGEESASWTILVISMESGFSSLTTFNRVFKSFEGCTPNQFRKSAQNTEIMC